MSHYSDWFMSSNSTFNEKIYFFLRLAKKSLFNYKQHQLQNYPISSSLGLLSNKKLIKEIYKISHSDFIRNNMCSIGERQLYEIKNYNLPFYLGTADQFSMANSIENRAPFLDYRLIKYIGMKNNLSMKNLGIFSLMLAIQLLRGHIQMAYYTWIMLGLYIVIDFIFRFFIIRNKDFKWILYTTIGLLLSLVTSLSLYLPMLSYTPFSTRSSGLEGGAGIDYATEYSFSFSEIITFFIPSYYGFGDYTYWGTKTMTNFPN